MAVDNSHEREPKPSASSDADYRALLKKLVDWYNKHADETIEEADQINSAGPPDPQDQEARAARASQIAAFYARQGLLLDLEALLLFATEEIRGESTDYLPDFSAMDPPPPEATIE